MVLPSASTIPVFASAKCREQAVVRHRVASDQNKFGTNELSCHVQEQTNICQPDENATRPAWRDIANVAFDARDWRRRERSEAGKTTINTVGSGPRSKGETKPAQITSKTEGRAKGQTTLVSGVDLPIEILQVRHSFHGQAVLVCLALDVSSHQMPGQSLAGTLRFGTVCKRAIDSERAINGQYIHLDFSDVV